MPCVFPPHFWTQLIVMEGSDPEDIDYDDDDVKRMDQTGGQGTEGIYQRRSAGLANNRATTTKLILEDLQRKRFMITASSPFSGKTALCQLLCERAQASRGTFCNLSRMCQRGNLAT